MIVRTPGLRGNRALVMRALGIPTKLVFFTDLPIAAAPKFIPEMTILAGLPPQMMPKNLPRLRFHVLSSASSGRPSTTLSPRARRASLSRARLRMRFKILPL